MTPPGLSGETYVPAEKKEVLSGFIPDSHPAISLSVELLKPPGDHE
jgi:hypothetical protein